MFRLFIREKLKSSKTDRSKQSSTQRGIRNRRVYERFNVDHKHLTIMNEQDILLIREISSKGFSTQVSERGFERFQVGDMYSARMRYLGETYDLDAKVSWKSGKDTVGFELVNAERRTRDFMQRLLHPIALAHSLRKVEAEFMKNKSDGKTWYHGDGDTDLYTWKNSQGKVSAWQLISKDTFVDWEAGRGLRTGFLTINEGALGGVLELDSKAITPIVDDHLNPKTRQFAIDILMACTIEERDDVMQTILEE